MQTGFGEYQVVRLIAFVLMCVFGIMFLSSTGNLDGLFSSNLDKRTAY